ncbi:glycosyltransferase family 4 protein [Desulfovibrio ferrophilus]|uniref:Group 1 glycosyl transferase n=1 Tax=Desulfovibrio ferrophilus TaxID=241368 RepID=A0A2Z6AZG6_9BACT|nr:glycosyltransferase family 4 protein [Desulfovibrio ferrophilus]BBD08639.1 group 1 glycosyl transferase [Desulfovibrio ferrophilus]
MSAVGAPIPVLHITGSLGLGGTEKTLQLFVSHLDKARFSPSVFAFEDGPRRAMLAAKGIDVFVGGDLLVILQRLRPAIVHLHRPGWPDPKVLRLLRLAGVPAVVETNVFGRFDPSPQAKIIDRHLFVSRFCLERYGQMNQINVKGPRYQVLYNPVDTDLFARYSRQNDAVAHCVGRLSRPDPGKWSALALEMLPHLQKHIPDMTYRVIGGTPKAKQWVHTRGLDDHVKFCEAVHTDEELADFFNSISVLAHANDTGESFGLVIAEAMAAGLPVVTHPCPSPKDNAQLELVEHGQTGLIATTAEEYATAVAWLLNHPREARAMGEAGRAKAQRLYRAQTVTRQLETIYQDLLDSSQTTAGHSNEQASIQEI